MTERDGQEAGIQARLRSALADAIRTRDAAAVAALRSALGAIANAEAVPPDPAGAPVASSPHVAGAAAGLGAAEAERRRLTEADVEQIVRAEAAERLTAAEEYERGGRADRADRLRHEAAVLTSALAP
jgi:uncharacterized protein